MEGMMNLRMELGIDAQRLVSQTQIYNQDLQKLVAEGIEKAIQEIFSDEEAFKQMIADQVISNIATSVRKMTTSYWMSQKISEAINQAAEQKISETADKWIEQITQNINKPT